MWNIIKSFKMLQSQSLSHCHHLLYMHHQIQRRHIKFLLFSLFFGHLDWMLWNKKNPLESNGWNGCFQFYLSNRKQYVSINGSDSNLADVKLGVPQWSVLGLLLFLIYINNLNQALKFCNVHSFAEDANFTSFW